MTTKPHAAVFIRKWNQHYHADCVSSDYVLRPNDVTLDMNNSANIAQCMHMHTLCFECKQPIVLFPDRKELLIREWPDHILPDIGHATQFANNLTSGAIFHDDGDAYAILYAWVIPPATPDTKGEIRAICELEEPVAPAKERYTPGGWTSEQIGACAWEVTAPARQDDTVCIIISNEADARLIVEAPNMFPLLKEFIRQHTVANGEECDCHECEAARAIVARVLGEE